MSANTTSSTSTTSTSSTGAKAGENAGEAIKSVFAKGHGIGESLRGNINAGIDSLTGTSSERNDAIAAGGEREFKTGKFEKQGTTDKAL